MVSECVNLEILRYVTGPGVRTSVTVCAERQTEHQPTDTVDPAGNPERREKPPSYHPTVDWLIGKNSAIINRHLIFFTIKLFNSWNYKHFCNIFFKGVFSIKKRNWHNITIMRPTTTPNCNFPHFKMPCAREGKATTIPSHFSRIPQPLSLFKAMEFKYYNTATLALARQLYSRTTLLCWEGQNMLIVLGVEKKTHIISSTYLYKRM